MNEKNSFVLDIQINLHKLFLLVSIHILISHYVLRDIFIMHFVFLFSPLPLLTEYASSHQCLWQYPMVNGSPTVPAIVTAAYWLFNVCSFPTTLPPHFPLPSPSCQTLLRLTPPSETMRPGESCQHPVILKQTCGAKKKKITFCPLQQFYNLVQFVHMYKHV